MKKYLICTLLAISVLQINANTFEQANQAYNKKDYEQAVALYTQCVEQGYSNATLYYNLGNAHFKADHLSQAILWYERALRIDPSNEDIIHNLAFANQQIIDKIDSEPFFLYVWGNKILHLFSSNGWAITAIIMSLLTSISIALIFIGKRASWRIRGLVFSIICGILMICSIIFAWIGYRQLHANNEVIVTAMSVTVKSTPDASGTDLFTVHEGLKAIITDKTAGWIEVKFPNDEKGWIPQSDAEII
ncbi:MAG: tetratricopeptide repeat protein [Bacteroidales bacterium]|nr:tetratricopeptide repeat protein [Bacteroidales bacterium]